jgi:hypothetical protein
MVVANRVDMEFTGELAAQIAEHLTDSQMDTAGRIEWLKEQMRRDYPWNEFHPSHLAGICLRKRWYELLKHKETGKVKIFTSHTQGIFMIGNLFHWFLQGLYPGADVEIELDTIKRNGYTIHGTPDMVYAGELYDFKSTSGIRYVRNAPQAKDTEQANAYMGMMRELDHPLKTSMGRIVYMGKTAMEMASHSFKWSLEGWDTFLLKCDVLYAHVVKDQVPPGTSCYECKFCDDKDDCNDLGTEE